MRCSPKLWFAIWTVLAFLAPWSCGADDQVSYFRQVKPLLNQTCAGCHKPEKSKGDLDLTVVSLIVKGGKHGAAIAPGDPGKSKLIEMISGEDPDMPKDADPLSAAQVGLLTRWIQQGAKDDTPAPGSTHIDPPIYIVPPVISAMAYSPDGSTLAVSGWHEVLLVKSDGSGLVGRLTGECPRIESLAFTSDGKTLGVAGGARRNSGRCRSGMWPARRRRILFSRVLIHFTGSASRPTARASHSGAPTSRPDRSGLKMENSCSI